VWARKPPRTQRGDGPEVGEDKQDATVLGAKAEVGPIPWSEAPNE
jgi:hypothetical protein